MTDSQQPPDEQPLTRRTAREAEKAPRPAAPTELIGASEAAAVTPESAPAAGSGGLGALIRTHPTAWLAGSLGVVFLLLGTGAVFAGVAVGSNDSPASALPTPTPTVDPPRAVPSTLPAATRLRTCSVTGPASDPRLAQFQGYVMNAATGEVLFDRGGTTPARTGSVLKILTAAAALSVLGPAYQLSTRVVVGSTPGTVVLVGGGDATISALPAGSESFYKGAPKLDDLAAQVMGARGGEPVTEVILDASYWSPSTGGIRRGNAPSRPSATTPR